MTDAATLWCAQSPSQPCSCMCAPLSDHAIRTGDPIIDWTRSAGRFGTNLCEMNNKQHTSDGDIDAIFNFAQSVWCCASALEVCVYTFSERLTFSIEMCAADWERNGAAETTTATTTTTTTTTTTMMTTRRTATRHHDHGKTITTPSWRTADCGAALGDVAAAPTVQWVARKPSIQYSWRK